MTEYTVQPGDTLGSIAKATLGNAALYTKIAEANNIENVNNVSVGTVLTIPGDDDSAGGTAAASGASTGTLSAEQLGQILGSGSDERVDTYLGALNDCCAKYEINTSLRMANFLAQVCHESNSFRAVSENLNYSAKALRGVFGKYFKDDEIAEEYARQPEKIANRVYANRMGNGDEDSGDGWAYRGRGLMQLTGKNNYQSFSDAYGADAVGEPVRVAEDPELCVAVAGWYWDSNKLNALADEDDVKKITKKINGGYNGLGDREEKLARFKGILGA